MRLVLHSISAVSTAFSASSCEGSPYKMFRMKQRFVNAIMDEQDPAREPRLLLVSYYLAPSPTVAINSSDLRCGTDQELQHNIKKNLDILV